MQQFLDQHGEGRREVAPVPIPGTTKFHRLTENNGAATVSLSDADLAAIRTILEATEVQGDRYPAALASMAGR